MKRKLVSVLLALTMCVGLAVSAFADSAGEPSAPEEIETIQNEEAEILQTEEDLVLPDPATENGGTEWVAETVFTYGHLHGLEEAVEEDGTTWQRGYQCSDASCPYLQKFQAIDTLSITAEGPPSGCIACGYYNWGSEKYLTTIYAKTESLTTHEEQKVTIYYCQTAGCSGYVTRAYPSEVVAHSWSKGSYVRSKSSSGSTHVAEYNYSCVCGATKTGTETHPLGKNGYTGNNYHKGALHYLEWEWGCGQCSYTVIKWESRSCPGSPSGEGCIIPVFGVKPPVEVESTDPVEDVTAPEDVTVPEEADIPEEVDTFEEVTEPEETIPPEETVLPEEPDQTE